MSSPRPSRSPARARPGPAGGEEAAPGFCRSHAGARSLVPPARGTGWGRESRGLGGRSGYRCPVRAEVLSGFFPFRIWLPPCGKAPEWRPWESRGCGLPIPRRLTICLHLFFLARNWSASPRAAAVPSGSWASGLPETQFTLGSWTPGPWLPAQGLGCDWVPFPAEGTASPWGILPTRFPAGPGLGSVGGAPWQEMSALWVVAFGPRAAAPPGKQGHCEMEENALPSCRSSF